MYFLYANPQKPDTIVAAEELARVLIAHKQQVVLDEWLYNEVRLGEPGSLHTLSRHARAIVSFGGDGTLLRTAATAASLGVPMLGVNMGRVGFLLETDPGSLESTAQRLIRGDYQLEERMMLNVCINDGEEALVLNDVVLCRGANPSSITVYVYADEELVYTTHGDGVIVATPTGSTAYCLSAGGPVLHPGLACTCVLPICTHKAQQLPIVLKESVRIRLRAEAIPGRAHQVIVDGQTAHDVMGEVWVDIRRADVSARFIRLDARQQFFTRLRIKQAEWSGK